MFLPVLQMRKPSHYAWEPLLWTMRVKAGKTQDQWPLVKSCLWREDTFGPLAPSRISQESKKKLAIAFYYVRDLRVMFSTFAVCQLSGAVQQTPTANLDTIPAMISLQVFC